MIITPITPAPQKKLYRHKKSGLRINQSKTHTKKFITFVFLEYFIGRGHNISHFYEMCITTISIKR